MTTDAVEPGASRVAIIGAGNIGRAFALLFADAGFGVELFESDPATRDGALGSIADSLADLDGFGLCHSAPAVAIDRISLAASLDAAVSDAMLVQECVPEDLPAKRRIFAEIVAAAPADAVVASASSALPISAIAGELPTNGRCLVAHPGNPPFLLRVVELVPAEFTTERAMVAATSVFRASGLSPVRLRREIAGFVFNRLQGAVLREAYCLVRDGVASVEDIDTIVRDGLGLRWAVVGPFETSDLNRRGGIAAHAKIMGAAYAAMGEERGQHDPWTPDLVAEVAAQRRDRLPLADWDARVAWRDRELMRLLAARRG